MKHLKPLFLLAFLLVPGIGWAQTGTITGTITDSLGGATLPGVNVVIAGTQQGAASTIIACASAGGPSRRSL